MSPPCDRCGHSAKDHQYSATNHTSDCKVASCPCDGYFPKRQA